MIIGFDTETTGFFHKNKALGDKAQPHLVQLGAIVYDNDNKPIQSMDVIIRPDGWDIPVEASNVHGITTEHAMNVGVSELVALDTFIALWQRTRSEEHTSELQSH